MTVAASVPPPPPSAGSKRFTQVLYAVITYAVVVHVLFALLPPRPPQEQQQPAPATVRCTHGGGESCGGGAVPSQGDTTHLFSIMSGLVEPHGYPLEEHFVTTRDGFILRMFRIPRGRGGGHHASTSSSGPSAAPAADTACPAAGSSGAEACVAAASVAGPQHRHAHAAGLGATEQERRAVEAAPRPVALLQHALMDSSAGWTLLGPRRALAFQLADQGFDVWLANSRGNRYSRNHTTLDPDVHPEFWRWSWGDMADADVPAMVEHVAAATRQERMVLFGYSQGSMIALASLASQPRVAARISLAVLLVPVAFTRHMASAPFVALSRLGLDNALLAAGWGEWGAHTPGTARRAQSVCSWIPKTCGLYLTAVCGSNPRGNLEPQTLSLLMGHLPVGTSVVNMNHWSQGIRRGSTTALLRYDHGTNCWGGRACNQAVYGQREPPAYNLSAITTPIALFTGDRDALSPPADVALLKAALPPGVLVAHTAYPDYAHLDLEVGADAADVAYPEILELARRAAGSSDGTLLQARAGGTGAGSAAAPALPAAPAA